MGFASQISAFFLLASLSLAISEVDALRYASVSSDDGMFELQWAYNHSKLIFKMKCKGIGWCGVGFSNSSGDGSYHAMVNYDIAAGGVASNTPYLDDYWSTTTTAPSKDLSQNWNLLKASQEAGYTNVEFERNVTTGDIFDVQFKNDTEVWIMWGLHSTDDANDGLTTKHESRGVIKPKHNLIMEAISAGPTPTATNGASEQGSRVVAYAILAFSACALLL